MGIFGRKGRPADTRPLDTPQDAPRDTPQDGPQDARPQSMSQDTRPQGALRPVGPQDAPMPGGDDDDGSRWIYEVAGEYSSETWAPRESIRRWWRVDRDGNELEGPVENENFGPPQNDLRRATDPDGPLSWLPDPEATVRGWLSVALDRIGEGIEVHWLQVTGTPLVLAGHDVSDFAPPDFDGTPPPRIGVAVPVGFGAQMAGHSLTVLWGLLLWVTVSEDPAADPKQNVWLRHEVDAERADELLRIVLQAPDIRF